MHRLSHTQQRLWFMSRLKPESAFYNLPLLVRLRGRLHIEALEEALNEISRRHEVLRTKFVEIDDEPMQVVDESSRQKLEVIDADGAADGLRIVRAEVRKPFELTQDYLWRVFVVRVSDQEHLLAIVMHHIISDGWSLNVLANEISVLYSAYAKGAPSPLKELPMQWSAYAEWQRESLSQEEEQRQLRYWHEQLAGSTPVLQLPSDRPRPSIETFEGSMYYATLPASLTAALRSLSMNESSTLFVTLLAAFNVLVHRYTGQTDLNIGTPLAGRNSPDVENLIGFFVNTIAIRTKLSDNLRFRDLLKQVRETTIGAYAHQDVQFDKVVEDLQIERSLSHAPVFQIVFAYNPGNVNFELSGLEATRLDIDTQNSKFDLAFFVEDAGTELKLLIEYSTALFDTATIERLTNHFQTLLENIDGNPDQTISELKLLTDAETEQLALLAKGASKSIPQDLRIEELFEREAQRTPDALAVVSGDERITYDALNRRANQLGHYLRSLGVGPETISGICMTRSLNMIVGALGILKAGGAYAPLDPAYPKERIAFMLEETAAPLLLTESTVLDRLPDCAARLVCLEDEKAKLDEESELTPSTSSRAENLAYVIFTSGSSGKPKGTALNHTGLVNLACWHQEIFTVEHGAKVSLVAGPSFDASVWELWANLTSGATLYLADAETILSPAKLWQWLNDRNITHCFLPTPLVETLLPVCEADPVIDGNLRYLFTGGDKLHRRPSRDLPFQFVNLYGLSEATVINTAAVIESRAHDDSAPLIGTPINNTQIHILDRQLRPVPIGVVGELYIGGAGLGRCYINQPELTATKFIPDPYSAVPGARMYRTGDLARYVASGNIECLGRIDGQVKIRGFRIELGEIQTALAQHEGVREAVAVVRPDGRGGNQIVAYIVQNAKDTATADELRRYLKKTLPEYMVPAVFITLDALPLTPNGKLDHKKLPDVDSIRPDLEENYVSPRSEIERSIAEIWQDVLQVPRVGIYDNFFNLGGHSLLLVQVNNRLREVLQTDISMIDMFRYPTVSALAEYLGLAERPKPMPYRPQAERQRKAGSRNGRQATEVAIVGMAGRFPEAKNLSEFWQNLKNGVESISFFSDAELTAAGVNSERADPNYVPAKAVLEDVDLFDAAFFDYNPREAEMLDPQHRVLLECAVEALEHAGYDPDRFAGRIGVYAGVSAGSYLGVNLNSHPGLIEKVGPYQVEIGNRGEFVPTTISFKLNLKGPSLNIQTACSTSLVAVHTACRSLLNGDCDMALAGGGSITFPHKNGYIYQKEGIMSPDGHCRAFDEDGRGTVAGEGAALIVLKRLVDAVADGDTIHAVIKGSAINNDGSLKLGFTAPSIDGQAKVISEALTVAGVSAESIDYVETHGTGTILGDPIEIAALTQAYHAGTPQRGFCAIGSLKTNIGHLDAAAGIAGLIKTVLALKHRQIPPSLHFKSPNAKINFEETPFFVNGQLRDWTARNGRRRTAVSSFGIGGTNAHVILEEAPAATTVRQDPGAELVVLSAKTNSALESATQQLVRHLKEHPNVPFADIAFTLQVGRREFPHRRVLVCSDGEDAIRELTTPESPRVFSSFQEPGHRPCVFLFPGQGAQYAGMSKELYDTQPVFREEIDRCAELLRGHLNLNLRDVIYSEDASALTQTSMTQPALFVVEYAAARLLMSWGVEPAAMIGHSIGEYVAACLAGVFSLEDALALVAARGALVQTLPGGQMLAVPLAEDDVKGVLPRGLSVAVVNAPKSCVVAGPIELVQQFQTMLEGREIHSRLLQTSHAFHSEMLEPILDEFTRRVGQVQLRAPAIPFISNVSGTWITSADATNSDYWTRHLRQTVRFADGMRELFQKPDRIFIEVGPGRTLQGLAKQSGPRNEQRVILNTMPGRQKEHSDVNVLLTALGKFWLAGGRVDWFQFNGGKQRRRVPLPTYPFERKRHFVDPQPRHHGSNGLRTHKAPLQDWLYVPSWKRVALSVSDKETEAGAWLVFVDEAGVGAALAKRLRSAGREAITVRAGRRFSKAGRNNYTIDPRNAEDYQSLLRALSAENVRRVVHLWSLTKNEAASGEYESGLGSLIFLTQALAQNISASLQLLVVTHGTQEVTGEEILHPEKATVLSACKVIPLEHPNISCRSIDVSTTAPERLVRQLFTEVSADSEDRVTAYRGRHRWVQTFETVAESAQSRLRERGVYMITDGRGRMGLAVARFLAQNVRARIALLTRDVAARSEWPPEFGELLVQRADGTDERQMREAVAAIEARFGELHGVIHTGSVTAVDKEMAELTLSDFERDLHTTARELNVVERILAGRGLDFCLLFSSLSSVLGRCGSAANVAMNILVDVAVQKHNQQTMENWTSVNWDRIKDSNPHFDEELAIREEEVGEVLERVLSLAPTPQVVVSTTDLQSRLEAEIRRAVKEDPQQAVAPPEVVQAALSPAYAAPASKTEKVLAEIWEDLLGIDRVGVHDNFFDLEGHSLLGTIMITRIRKSFGVDLELTEIFRAPTLQGLALLIEQRAGAHKSEVKAPMSRAARRGVTRQ